MPKQFSKNKCLDFNFELLTKSGPVLKPYELHFKDSTPHAPTDKHPLPYLADAMCGISALKVFEFCGQSSTYDPQMVDEAWNTLDTNQEMYFRSHPRITSLRKKYKSLNDKQIKEFEANFYDIVKSATHDHKINFETLFAITESINFLEQKLAEPLIYNLKLQLSDKTVQCLHALYSLLFHTRALVAVDHNAHTKDTAFEAVKVDSVTDYLPKAEYVVNDAMVYHYFQKLSHHYKTDHKDFEQKFIEPMDKVLKHFCHNGFFLAQALPEGFLNSLNQEQAEESLYMVQMDWLLGSESGLLFRVREELYGMMEGYEKIFWHDAEHKPSQKGTKLQIHCEVTEAYLKTLSRHVA